MTFDAHHGARLREERERLGLSQQKAADAMGIRREMLGRYERGDVSPGGDVFIGLAALGVDVMYVISGRPAGASGTEPPSEKLSRREAALIDNYRNSSDEGKLAVEVAAAALAKQRGVGG